MAALWLDYLDCAEGNATKAYIIPKAPIEGAKEETVMTSIRWGGSHAVSPTMTFCRKGLFASLVDRFLLLPHS